jgi:hypothetical protein
MAIAHASDVIRLVMVIVVVFALATVATLVFGGPGEPLAFDLTPDPIGNLWTW